MPFTIYMFTFVRICAFIMSKGKIMEANLNAVGEKKQTVPGQVHDVHQNTDSQASVMRPTVSNSANKIANNRSAEEGAAQNKSEPARSSWEAAAARADKTHDRQCASREQLSADLSALLSDVDVLLDRAGSLSREALQSSKEQLIEKMHQIKAQLNDLGEKAAQSKQHTVETVQTYVRAKPLKSLGVALGAGIFLGMLLHKRRV